MYLSILSSWMSILRCQILPNSLLNCFLNTFFMTHLCTFPYHICLEVAHFPLSLLSDITPIFLVLPQILLPAWCCFSITPTKWHSTFLLYYEFKYNFLLFINCKFLESEDCIVFHPSHCRACQGHLRQEVIHICLTQTVIQFSFFLPGNAYWCWSGESITAGGPPQRQAVLSVCGRSHRWDLLLSWITMSYSDKG